MKTKIVGIKGTKQSGKDTVANIISYIKTVGVTKATFHDWEIRYKNINIRYLSNVIHFADKLKEDLSKAFNIDINIFYTKEGKESYYLFDKKEIVNDIPNDYIMFSPDIIWNNLAEFLYHNTKVAVQIRTLMQYFGTNIIRNTVYKDFYVNQTINNAINIQCKNDYCIIADVRFDNEEEAINKLRNSKIIRIDRDTNIEDDHESEQIKKNDTNYVIDNNGNLRKLYYKVYEFYIKNMM